MRPNVSNKVPENVAGPVEPAAPKPAIGTVMLRSAIATATQADLVIGLRSRRAFNMALILLSRLDGRAISGAQDVGSHVRL
jgi:hypothetical protein